MDSSFKFKKFSVQHTLSTMKVGTDAVVLGSWIELTQERLRCLEIGCGCGVISLIMAQRLTQYFEDQQYTAFKIDAIDIDAPSVEEASRNFVASPWASKLSALRSSFQHYSAEKYDLIFSNPPFFVNSLNAPEQRRNNARHSTELSHQELIDHSIRLLQPNGKLCLILPFEEGQNIITKARFTKQLQLLRICKLYTSTRKPPKRLLLEFLLSDTLLEEVIAQDLVINSPEYGLMVGDLLK